MALQDLISASVRLAWSGGGNTALMPAANVYYGRAQQPAELPGFPYSEMDIVETDHEVMTGGPSNALVTYELKITTYTAQGMTGGASSGLQVTDQGNLMRAWEGILNTIPPNQAWNTVPTFLHCIQVHPSETVEDMGLYLGKDVFKSILRWSILVTE